MKSSPNSIIFGGFYSPPFMKNNGQEDWQGPLIELASQIALEFRHKPLFKNLTQQELNSFDRSEIHIGLGIFKTEVRKRFGSFSYPLFHFGLQGLGFQDYGASSFDELTARRLRFGTKEGEIGHDFLLNNYGYKWVAENCSIIPAYSPLDTWHLLAEHECDIILLDALTLSSYKNEVDEPTWWSFSAPIMDIEMGLLISHRSPLTVEDVNGWLREKANTKVYSDFVYSVYGIGEARFKPCMIPSS